VASRLTGEAAVMGVSPSAAGPAASGVTDEAWANAAKHHDEEQLAALVARVPADHHGDHVVVI